MEPTFSGIYALQLAELLGRWGIPSSELFAGLGLSEAALAEPGAKLSLSLQEKVTERARQLSGEPGIAFALGLQMRIGAHGEVGIAAMTASTIREALEVATRFAPTRTTAIELRLREEGDVAALVIEERAPLGTMRDVVILALTVGIWQISNALTGRQVRGDADFAFEEPEYFQRFVGFAPGTIRFGRPANQLLFDAKFLDVPIVMADRATQRVAREQCERALEALGRDGSLTTRVRELAAHEGGGFNTLEDIAKQLAMSERTLKRKLGALGTSFTELIDDQRRDEAMLLLRSRDLSIEDIADRLGYSDAANFTRAFRRWTGKSPRAFRKG
jgi:AraC-like DNA-binding protein